MQKRKSGTSPTTTNKSSKGRDNQNADSTTPKDLNVNTVGFLVALHIISLYTILFVPLYQQTLQLLIVFYMVTMFSLSAGYHRLYSHNTYQAIFPFRLFVAIFGSASFSGPIVSWVRTHRAHHRFHGKSQDPMNINKGLLHAHLGWLCYQQAENKEIDTSDIEKDPAVQMQSQYYQLLSVGVGLALPCVIGALWSDAWGGLLYAGVVRTTLVLHAYASTASIAHVFGSQKYSDDQQARNSLLVSILTLGEGNQNFNFAFPKDYRLGPRSHDWDPTKWALELLAKVGVVSNLQKTKADDITKARIEIQQKRINRKKVGLNFGPEPNELPQKTWAQLDEEAKKGSKFMVIDGLVHDVTNFIKEHPGGIKILDRRVGKDATLAFNGVHHVHSKASRNLLATLRKAKLVDEEMDARVESDHFKRDDE